MAFVLVKWKINVETVSQIWDNFVLKLRCYIGTAIEILKSDNQPQTDFRVYVVVHKTYFIVYESP